MQSSTQNKNISWLDRPLFDSLKINWEILIFVLIVILAIISRYADLGARVMSHDESLHVYYSWKLYKGEGFQHTPMMHGPLQFHLTALSYFLFGDTDFTARIIHALASVLAVVFLWNYRRYLGKAGALVAALLYVISPYMLYYGRYARNESLVSLFGLMTVWGILRYLETGKPRYIYWVSAATALHFCTKETSFIYTAQALLFLGFYFLNQVGQKPWPKPEFRKIFFICLMVALILLGAAAGIGLFGNRLGVLTSAETAAPPIPGPATPAVTPGAASPLVLMPAGLGFLVLLVALYFLFQGYTLGNLRNERSFDLIIVIGTLVFPHLSAFPVDMMGWNATDYSSAGLTQTSIFLVPMILISIGIGMWWNPSIWLRAAGLFYGIFVLLFTTLFTNGNGFFSGLVGSLGYWLEQQGVKRGNQPWYFYLLIQLPIYEFLALLGSFLALILSMLGKLPKTNPPEEQSLEKQEQAASALQPVVDSRSTANTPHPPFRGGLRGGPAMALIGFWTATSILAYTIAGEKMPWLTVHINLPMILLSGWALGYLIETTDWSPFKSSSPARGWLTMVVLPVFVISLSSVLGSLFGPNPPFQGKELDQLQATSIFLTAALTTVISGWGLFRLLRYWPINQFVRIATLVIFTLLGVLTARTAYTAAFINRDAANEYLVYAHSARGVKEVMAQVEDLSRRISDGLAMPVAYDDDTSWPMTWYLRNYTNQRYYGNTPGKDLRELPVIIVGDSNYGKIEPIVGQAYYRFDYIRMIWPNQDYFDFSTKQILEAIRNPRMRAALFDIWLNRDFTAYGQVTGKDMSITNWNPSDRMRLYIRKDIANQIWQYGTAPAPAEVVADPYEGGQVNLVAERIIGINGNQPGQFQSPRDVAIAPDGTLYVADSGNHRIQHIALDDQGGFKVLKTWGSFGEGANVPGGIFNEPWGIAVGPDGSVYVADTWNHRIQKFTKDGDFLIAWGYFGQAEKPEAFWGPRDVTVDALGRVFVTDTGNKRVVVFNPDGQYITEFGSYGMAAGQFDENVGIAVDAKERVFVADTWNQRLQVFAEQGQNNFISINSWDIAGWYGQSLDNKPYVTVDEEGHVLVSDPEGYRVIEFTAEGQFMRFWGDYSTGPDGFGIVNGLDADMHGGVWVCDAGNHRLLHFILPK